MKVYKESGISLNDISSSEEWLEGIERIYTKFKCKQRQKPSQSTIKEAAEEIASMLRSKILNPKDKDEYANRINQYLTRNFPPVQGDRVIQIGTVAYRYGDKTSCSRHIITLGSCDPIPGCEVVACETETQVLLAWRDHMLDLDPDIVTGYNIFGFDYKYLCDRSIKLECYNEF